MGDKPREKPDDPRWATLSRAQAAALLRAARERSGRTIGEAEAITGINGQQIRDYESGHRQPTYQALHRLVTALGYDLSSLFPKPSRHTRPKANREAS
jgi:transcriptional regulator with XRE-family HTH domain